MRYAVKECRQSTILILKKVFFFHFQKLFPETEISVPKRDFWFNVLEQKRKDNNMHSIDHNTYSLLINSQYYYLRAEAFEKTVYIKL